MKNLFIVVDGSSFLFRAYHALPPLTNSKNHPTGAMYGVINMLRKLVSQYPENPIAIIFDSKEKTIRHEQYEAYKANRPEMPEDLAQQIKPLFEIIEAMGLPLIVKPGIEADDIIGTLAASAKAHHIQTIIATCDKDMAQLVDDDITLMNTMTDTRMDHQGVIEKFGVRPDQIIDYLSLVGDTSDNVPGVPKCGPKTAAKWLAQYDTLDNLIAHASEITGKVGEYLREFIPQFPLVKKLVTINQQIPLDFSLESIHRKPANTEKLMALFREYEFKNWLNTITPEPPKKESAPKSYHKITTVNELDSWIKKLSAASLLAFDTETTSLDVMKAELVGLSFSIAKNEAIYIPLQHHYENCPAQLPLDLVLQKLKPLFENPNIKKLGHNVKYDLHILQRNNIHVKGVTQDSMLESYTLDSNARHGMDALAEKCLNYKTVTFEDVAGKGAKQITFDKVELDIATNYAAEDADITLQLHHYLHPLLEKNSRLLSVYDDIEMPLISVLQKMEAHGVLIDTHLLKIQEKELLEKIKLLEEKAFILAGGVFNLNSPKQLQEILYDKLKLPILAKTPTKQPSTSEDVLQTLSANYELPAVILENRSLSKLLSTYVLRLPEQMDPKTHRVHTSFHQAVTSTGRLSSSDPNLQNIPIRTEEGRRIRKAFIAPEGYQLVAADYSQIELRIMAHLSNDKGLLDAFAKNLDVHRATAAEVFSTPFDQVTDAERRAAKAINFGLIYGMSAFGLAKQLNVSREEAQAYIEVYFHRYPGVKHYMESTRKLAHEQGFVETLWGRRLYLPEINSKKYMVVQAQERAAINGPLQGSAADIIKKAMLCMDKWIHDHPEKKISMILQVHDELIFEVPKSEVELFKPALESCMMNAAQLRVPLLVDIGVGHNWDET